MSGFLRKVKVGFDTLMVVLRMSCLIINPKDISPIFKARAFREHRSMLLALESLRSKPEVAALMQERYLAPAPYDLNELIQLPPGTPGRAYAEQMQEYKLELFPPPEDKDKDDDIAYMRLRSRQTHGIHHVVLGLPPVDIGEMAISAFYLAQNRIPLSALLIGIGFLYTILRQPHRIDELMNAIIKGWTMGKQATDVLGVRWEEYWHMPLSEVRQMINVQIDQSQPLVGNEAMAKA